MLTRQEFIDNAIARIEMAAGLRPDDCVFMSDGSLLDTYVRANGYANEMFYEHLPTLRYAGPTPTLADPFPLINEVKPALLKFTLSWLRATVAQPREARLEPKIGIIEWLDALAFTGWPELPTIRATAITA